MKKVVIITFFFLHVACFLQAQLILVPIGSKANEQKPFPKTVVYNQLPFTDDFSDYEGIPNPNKWQQGNVVVNRGYQYNPPSLGVATLDATDLYGKLYPAANTSSFGADTLCSQPIRLDSVTNTVKLKLSPKDSIYLSFFVQPAGGSGPPWESIGSTPSKSDSIILEFYSSNQEWKRIWAMGGIEVDSLFVRNGAYYQYVLIPIVEEEFFIKDFQIRFRNTASCSNNPLDTYVGNCDQWNIDYVFLDRNRNCSDTTRRDLAFVDPAPSLLKRYQSMPARQFTSEEMSDNINIKIVNLSDEPLSSTYKFFITDEANQEIFNYDGGFENIAPYITAHSYQTAQAHANPTINYSFDINPQSWERFTITHIIKEGVGQDMLSANDTMRFEQIFENYFAYDDGSAENGIGVEPISESHLAVAYELNTSDTLTAVDIYFNSSLNEANFKPFFICVWNASGNLPGEMIHKTEQLIPSSDSLNRFARFVLDEPLILPAGRFFISLQSKSNDYLNIGFDRNTNSSQYTYSKTSADWEQSFLKGSVMLRPYFGRAAWVGLKDAERQTMKVYPNPTSGRFYVQTEGQSLKRIYDLSGRLLLETKDNQVDISSLSQGIYILKVTGRDGITGTEKIIKTN